MLQYFAIVVLLHFQVSIRYLLGVALSVLISYQIKWILQVITEFTSDAKITYKSQNRTTLDKKRLEEDLGSLEEYEKTISYNVLRVR